jgi:hypothetical protein
MIGSLLSIKVFSSTKIRRNSSNEYLITSKRILRNRNYQNIHFPFSELRSGFTSI